MGINCIFSTDFGASPVCVGVRYLNWKMMNSVDLKIWKYVHSILPSLNKIILIAFLATTIQVVCLFYVVSFKTDRKSAIKFSGFISRVHCSRSILNYIFGILVWFFYRWADIHLGNLRYAYKVLWVWYVILKFIINEFDTYQNSPIITYKLCPSWKLEWL